MNATSRAILQTVLSTDGSMSAGERGVVQRIINGETEVRVGPAGGTDERLLVTQKAAAELLSVSRVTIWRMTKDCALNPAEILPGTWRYPYQEIVALARGETGVAASANAKRREMSVA
jgi:hypothetical protein